jgi:glycosyltransferase involved in cell wall biosynthesis
VIVPFRNARGHLPGWLRAIEQQTIGAARFEVLLVDDHSVDGGPDGVDLPAGLRLRTLHAPRRGSYAARNAGVREAAADVLAFTDADCLPEPAWLEQGLAALARAPRVAGRVGFDNVHDAPTRVDADRFLRQEGYAAQGYAATANLFVARAVFDDVGGFEERLTSGADIEWGLRAHARGHAIAYAHDAVVRHPARDLVALLSKGHRVGFGVGQALRLGLLPAAHLRRRVADRARVSMRGSGAGTLGDVAVRALIAAASAVGVAHGALRRVDDDDEAGGGGHS